MKRFPSYDHPLAIRHNQRFCRIARSRPGHKKNHPRFLPRWRDIEMWRALGGGRASLSLFSRRGPGPIAPLKHAVPFHLFPLSDRIEATRLRAKGITL
ncbi:hypothetical protein [Novosphingobium sp.]|uniref:hypothetical protein n=1 Tax=Novosphingobium sp. TaxID=1874826 RepID=UPI00261F301F|nr:hypothetical protein [Novosphingobium sp.]